MDEKLKQDELADILFDFAAKHNLEVEKLSKKNSFYNTKLWFFVSLFGVSACILMMCIIIWQRGEIKNLVDEKIHKANIESIITEESSSVE